MFFGTSSSELSGYRLLVFTALFCWLSLILINHFTQFPYSNYENDARKLDSLLIIMRQNEAAAISSIKYITLDKFDPNTATKEKLVSVGFPSWLATRLIKYRATGARFNTPTDLLKLYGFPEALYASIKPFVVIKPIPEFKKNKKPKNKAKLPKILVEKPKVLPVFDLNKADTAILQTIKGIGSKLSNRIVAYRSSLGGFVATNQLYQIYRLDSSVIAKIIKTSVILPDFIPKQIKINKATKEQLAAHPYINWSQAKLIIAYRNQHGGFINLNDLQKVYSIDGSWIKNNAPYLSF